MTRKVDSVMKWVEKDGRALIVDGHPRRTKPSVQRQRYCLDEAEREELSAFRPPFVQHADDGVPKVWEFWGRVAARRGLWLKSIICSVDWPGRFTALPLPCDVPWTYPSPLVLERRPETIAHCNQKGAADK